MKSISIYTITRNQNIEHWEKLDVSYPEETIF